MTDLLSFIVQIIALVQIWLFLFTILAAAFQHEWMARLDFLWQWQAHSERQGKKARNGFCPEYHSFKLVNYFIQQVFTQPESELIRN